MRCPSLSYCFLFKPQANQAAMTAAMKTHDEKMDMRVSGL